jgi:hypothetical protein
MSVREKVAPEKKSRAKSKKSRAREKTRARVKKVAPKGRR